MEQGQRILIVEDDMDVASMLTQRFATLGYEVENVYNGEEALQSVQRRLPDLILLDISLPKLDGYQVCTVIKENKASAHVPVIMITARNESEELVKALNTGADDFIQKPFQHEELIARVRAFLRAKKLHDELEGSFLKLKGLEETRDSLINMIVHDLRSPLTSILGGIQTVALCIGTQRMEVPVQLQLLKIAERSGLAMLEMINNILEINQMEQNQLVLNPEPMNIAQVARKCLNELGLSIAPGRVLLRADMEKEVYVLADSMLLQRILSNLLTNALKYTPPGGSIAVSLRRVPGAGEVECCVEDTGTGIQQEYLVKIFDKFFQVEKEEGTRSGFGLGLAFCRMAVESNGGRIWAESDGKTGSRFLFRLPAA